MQKLGWKYNSNQKWNNDKCWCKCKKKKENNVHEKGHIWKPATCTCENGKNLGSIIDDLVNICDEIINTANSASTNVMCTVSTNFHTKKWDVLMDRYILHAILLMVILPHIIAFICYHYAKHRWK